MTPLISIIIPSFNHRLYVSETIKSVLAQSYSNWEIILIDDCSRDDTFEIAKSLLEQNSRATLFKKNSNKGLVDSLNLGIAKARGQYIAFLASDDAWEKTFLEISLDATSHYPNSIIFSDAVGSRNNFIGLITSSEMRKRLLKHNPVLSVGCIYPTDFLKRLIDIETSVYLEDYYIRWMSVFVGLNYYATGQKLIRYRNTKGSMSSNIAKMRSGRRQLYRLVEANLSGMEKNIYLFNIAINNLLGLIFFVIRK